MEKAGTTTVGILCISLVAAVLAGCGKTEDGKGSQSKPSDTETAKASPTAQPVPSQSLPTNLEEAKTYFTGTWVGAKMTLDGELYKRWGKLVLEKDGGYSLYQANPTDDDWPKRETYVGAWEAVTGKFANTGERYYAVRLTCVLNVNHSLVETDLNELLGTLILDENGLRAIPTAQSRLDAKDWDLRYLKKGDVSPFSK